MGVLISLSLFLLGLIFLLILKFYVITKMRMKTYTRQGLVEYSYFPLFGIFHEWMNRKSRDCMHQIKEFSHQDKFKDADGVVSNLQDRAFILLTNPKLINDFLQSQEYYIKFEQPLIGFKQFLGNGITLSEGEEWKQKRKFLSNMFKFDVIKNFLSTIRQISIKMLERNDPSSFNTQIGFSDLTGALSLSLFIGADIDDYLIDGQNPSSAIDTFSSEIFQHYLTPFASLFGQKVVQMNLRDSDKKINEKCKVVREFMRNILKDSIKREKSNIQMNRKTENPNLVTFILEEGHKLENEKEIEDFLDVAFNVYFAAKDTSTTTICILLYYLVSHPQIYKKLEDEILKLPQAYSFNDVQQLDYLQSCIKEALRINPTAPIIFTRECIKNHSLGKYKISKGTYVNIGIITNQLDNKYFENPLEFNPERWQDEKTKKAIIENPAIYHPFSGGMRNCIGQHLANLQIKVILIEFIRKFNQPKLPNDYSFEMTIVQSYAPKNPLILNLSTRNQN